MPISQDLSSKEFDRFRSLVYNESGINLSDKKRSLVVSRVSKRMRTLNFSCYSAYLDHLEQDKSGNELIQLLDAISTNVTRFFREEGPFDFMSEKLAEWEKAGQKRFRIWCAASSSGEEPYSMGIIIREILAKRTDTKILATDISTTILEKARTGEYEDRLVEQVPIALRNKYFNRFKDGEHVKYRVSPDVKDLITFGRLNLSRFPFPLKGPLDIIFCRNVMIYFDNQLRAKLLKNMYELLKPGGYLMVGSAESLTGTISDFDRVLPSIYLKPRT